MNILLTGGLGYIGTHTAIALAESGHTPILFDNLSNSKLDVLDNLRRICSSRVEFVEGDVRNKADLIRACKRYKVETLIHFAGLKSVNESIECPIDYYSNNVYGTIVVADVLQELGIKKLVFSSSAAIYGQPIYLPIDEGHPTNPTNPYARSKLQAEEILKDLTIANNELKIITLRYFNPVGAHFSGLIGESPLGMPNNLMPYLTRVASGKLPVLNIFGGDYGTHDGTGVRDFIHVMDLARGHIAALNRINCETNNGESFEVFNLGTGKGCSVLDLVRSFEKYNTIKIPYLMKGRRPGDVVESYASADKARRILEWVSQESLETICKSQWLWENGCVK